MEQTQLLDAFCPGRGSSGRPEVGLALLDKLDRTLGRRSARKKATG
jgi:hypothetical protein